MSTLPPYQPKRLISTVSTDPEAYYEARREMAQLHVMHLRNRHSDPWDEWVDIKALDPMLRDHYKDLIAEERKRFVEAMELRVAEQTLEELTGKYFLEEVQHRWEGWLCARLGFLPEYPH